MFYVYLTIGLVVAYLIAPSIGVLLRFVFEILKFLLTAALYILVSPLILGFLIWRLTKYIYYTGRGVEPPMQAERPLSTTQVTAENLKNALDSDEAQEGADKYMRE